MERASKENLYFLIETLRRNGMKASAIHNIMNEAWPEDSFSERHVRKLVQEFRDGNRDSFTRKQGSGKDVSVVRTQAIERVEALIDGNSSLTVRQIATELGLSKTMVHEILTNDLELLWLSTKWVPHTLSEANKAIRLTRCQDLMDSFSSRLTKSNLVTIDEKYFYCRNMQPRNVIGSWLGPWGDEPRKQTARRSSMETKFMAIVAVSQRGEHYFEVLPRNEHINAERYVEFLINMEGYFANLQNPILPQNMRIQHDNAKPHTARLTTEHLEERNIRLLRQPPYSPDANLCDTYIFPRLESVRDDFVSRDDIYQFLTQEMPRFTAQRMSTALTELIQKMQKIINRGGNYV